jgi:hypothetical protein
LADLHVDANVTAPKVVHIPLVRADLLSISGTFRLFFDVFLAAAMMLLGASLSACNPVPLVQWVFFWVCICAAAIFMTISVVWNRRARDDV